MRSAVGLTSNLCCSKVLLGSLSCRWSHGAAIARVHGALRRSALSHSPLLYIATRASSSPASSPTSSDFLVLSDKDLLTQCKMDTFRASGPGGQHRNKTESAVRLKHIPTGLVSQASEDRSQHINRSYALSRLRQQIALKVRRPVELLGYKPPPEFLRILPTGKGQRSSGQQIGPNHADFPQGMQALLDLISATDGSVSVAANLLGISTSALSKIITSEKNLQLAANEIRASKGLKPLH